MNKVKDNPILNVRALTVLVELLLSLTRKNNPEPRQKSIVNKVAMMSNLVNMRIPFFKFQFKPSLLPTIATFIILPILISLGFWQLDRADQKRVLQADYDQRIEAPPLTISDIKDQSIEVLRFHSLKVTGHFDNQHTLLLDNQYKDQQLGYRVLTPMILKNNNKGILINRDFVPRGHDRKKIPIIHPVEGETTIVGNIIFPSSKQLMLSDHWQEDNRIQTIDIKRIEATTNLKLYPFVLQLEATPPINMPPSKHLGYAVQWFALAATLVVIYISLNVRRRLE